MKDYQRLLLNNKSWASNKIAKDPDFFERLVNVQSPEYLWIGCSDSRVPPNEITQTQPGEIFIHRNIANMVVHTDLNLLSVLQYAVEILKVKHIIVCGHYGCGGVQTALGNKNLGLIDNWLRNIKDVYRIHEAEIEILPENERLNELVRLNVKEQVLNLARTSIVQQAWKDRELPYLHGWVYDLHDGVIETVLEIQPGEGLESIVDSYNIKGKDSDMAS
jgi:carbonic anhydrase